MNRNFEVVFGVIEYHFVQFAAMAIEYRSVWILGRRHLGNDVFAGVFVNFKAMSDEIDTERSHLLGYRTVLAPSSKYPSSIGAKGYYVSQRLKNRERLIDFNIMALSMTFYSCREASESCWRGQPDDAFLSAKDCVPAPTMITVIPVLDFANGSCTAIIISFGALATDALPRV